MRIERFKEGKLDSQGAQAIVLDSLEDFPTVFPELLSTLEQQLAGAETVEAVQQVFADDSLLGTVDQRRYSRLGCFAITASFCVGANPIEEGTPFGRFQIAYTPGKSNTFPALSAPVALAHDVCIEFDWKRTVPMHGHGNGWKPYTSHSQFGSLYGDTGDQSGWSNDWVIFRSARAKAEYEKRGFDLGWKSVVERKDLSTPLPHDMQLILGVGWNGNRHRELDNGEVSVEAEYRGILLRAADLNWGDGEFVALVRHLGLGRGEQPRYTFERYNPPQR